MKIFSDYEYIITRVAGPCLTLLSLGAIIKIYGVDDYARTSILVTIGTIIYSFTLNQYLKSLPRAFFIRSFRKTLVKQYILISPILAIFFFFLLCNLWPIKLALADIGSIKIYFFSCTYT